MEIPTKGLNRDRDERDSWSITWQLNKFHKSNDVWDSFVNPSHSILVFIYCHTFNPSMSPTSWDCFVLRNHSTLVYSTDERRDMSGIWDRTLNRGNRGVVDFGREKLNLRSVPEVGLHLHPTPTIVRSPKKGVHLGVQRERLRSKQNCLVRVHDLQHVLNMEIHQVRRVKLVPV